jgi:hypothetical protein
MARLSSTARSASQDGDELEVDYSERAGFLTGKAAAIADWLAKKEKNDPAFRRLVWRLQWKKYWKSKDAVRKAAIVAYRKRWAKDNHERVRKAANKARKKRRGVAANWKAELAAKKAKRAVARQARRAATVYTCVQCGSQWSPIGRIPSRPPKYCDRPCLAKANYERGKKAGKAWALRTKEHRKDRPSRTASDQGMHHDHPSTATASGSCTA